MMNSVELPSNVISPANEALISDLQKLGALGQWKSCRAFALLRIYTDAYPRSARDNRSVSILELSTENRPFKMSQGTLFDGYVQNQRGGARAEYINGVLSSVDVICSVINYNHSKLYGGTVANSLVGLHKAYKIVKVNSSFGFTDGVVVMQPFNNPHLCKSGDDIEVLLGPVFINVPHSVTHEDPDVVNLVHRVRKSISTYTVSVRMSGGVINYVPSDTDSANTTRADRIRDEAYRQCGVPFRS